ncbi:MAG: hypothetical protein C0412_18850 [Flavobacterium sp.]|nr:hypothetical protein [Flavobacterium sp.]
MDNNHLCGKTILLVNTGSIKKKFILQRMKKFGLIIVCLNKEKNWAQPYVDHWILTDTYNHPESIEAIKEFLNNKNIIKIDGAITFWEDEVPLLAKICKEFKLIGNSIEASLNTRNKVKMQEIFKATGQPHIKQKLIKSAEDLTEAIKEIGFPAIIKPVFGANSEFVVHITNEQEARDAYKYVYKNCTADFDPIYRYNKKMFIYQKFIEGQEFSVECFSQHGVPRIIGIHEKTAMDLPFFMETGDYIPPRATEEEKNKLIKAVEAGLIVLGVRDSLAHVEIKLTKNDPKIIEVASRLGGDYTHENIWQVYNFDLIKTGCEIALGINVNFQPKEPKKFVIGKFFIAKNSGVITKISGFDEIKKDIHVIDISLSKKVGDSVLVPPDGYENIGWVLVQGDSYVEAERALTAVFEKINIEVAPFKSYSSFGKTLRKDRFSSALIDKISIIKSGKIEQLRNVTNEDLKNLRIGVACNFYDENSNEIEKDLTSVGKNIQKTLESKGYKVNFFDFNDFHKAIDEIRNKDIDLIFNVCERINDSSLLEPHVASIFDILRIPYTGSNPFTLSMCIDKIRVKILLNYYNIPTPKWDYAYSIDDKIRGDLKYPLIIKPANTDNSIGITNNSVVNNKEELSRQIYRVIKELDSPVLVEEYIEGDEYDVTVIGNDEHDLRVLPLSRSIFTKMPLGYWHIYPYASKWSDDPAYKMIDVQRPAKNISKRLESLLTEMALDTYNILDCHDYGRIEIRVDEQDNPYVLELNPNPSININDCVPKQAELIGMDYGKFLEEIIRMTIRRYKNRPPYYHLQTTF